MTGLDDYHALQKIAQFATLVATYEKGEYDSIREPNLELMGRGVRVLADFGAIRD